MPVSGESQIHDDGKRRPDPDYLEFICKSGLCGWRSGHFVRKPEIVTHFWPAPDSTNSAREAPAAFTRDYVGARDASVKTDVPV